MYIRFTTRAVDERSHKPRGIFTEAYTLLDSGDLSAIEWKNLRESLDWFSANLPVPPKKFGANRAIFWFRSAADENIRRVWDLVHILREHERHVTIYKCRRLGNITYSDKFQIAAYPSHLDGKVTQQ